MQRSLNMQTMARSLVLAVAAAAAGLTYGMAQNGTQADAKTGSATGTGGNAVNGRTIFEGAGGCLSCHRAGAVGAVTAPNLSDVGARLSADALKQILLQPATTVAAKNRLYQIVTKDGKTIEGKLLNQDSFSLQLLSTDGDLVAYKRSEVREGHFADPPRMPSYRDKLTDAQIDDLVAYLTTLRIPTGH